MHFQHFPQVEQKDDDSDSKSLLVLTLYCVLPFVLAKSLIGILVVSLVMLKNVNKVKRIKILCNVSENTNINLMHYMTISLTDNSSALLEDIRTKSTEINRRPN